MRIAVKNANKLVAKESEKIKSLLASKTVAFQSNFEQLHERLKINKESNEQLTATCERLRIRCELAVDREKEAKSELAKAKAQLDEAAQQKFVDINNVMDKEFEKTQKIEKSLEEKIASLKTRLADEKSKRREQVRLLRAEVNELQSKLERTKTIWKRSSAPGKRSLAKKMRRLRRGDFGHVQEISPRWACANDK